MSLESNIVITSGDGNNNKPRILPEEDKDNYFIRSRGSDPRAATCRGKLQNRRSKLNQEINKEMRLRAGAENLFKATTNKKMKETVALELSFVNSNLQLLKEQLSELNSSVEIYQTVGADLLMPMIPLGLKETKEIDFREPFKDFILEHYSEDGVYYENYIIDFMDTRQAMRTPSRTTSGIRLLFEYYNQLYFIERRFFPPERSLGIYFEWYDSLTGIPSCQRTVAFEKASLLFNIGALYTQLGAKQDRKTNNGLDSAVDNFLRASGTFRYIHENFTNAPSMDLSPEVLEMLVQLMLAQARECLYEKFALSCSRKKDIDIFIELGQEAAQVMEEYSAVHSAISIPPVKDYVPYSWISLVLVKRELYHALSHYYVGVGLLDHEGELLDKTLETLQYLHVDNEEGRSIMIDIRVPKDQQEITLLGKAHLRESILSHEESLRVHRMCRELRKKDSLYETLRKMHDRAFDKYAVIDEENDFREVLDPPSIAASTKFQLGLTPPDFSQYKVDDIMRGLGPVSIFNAKHHWTVPRSIAMKKHSGEGFGFSVRGDAPVMIAGVDSGSVAALGGMKEGDFIVIISEEDVKWASHDEVVALIKQAKDTLALKVITPMDKNNTTSTKSTNSKPKPNGKMSISPTSTTSSSSGVSSGSGCSRYHTPNGSLASTKSKDVKKLTWNLFKKHNKEKREQESVYQCNVILR